MAGRNGLVLQPAYRLLVLSASTLASMYHHKQCVSSDWQRNLRWKAKDTEEFITAMLRNVPVPLVILAKIPPALRPLGTAAEYYIVDGQNRLAALSSFMCDSSSSSSPVTVRACDVFEGVPNIKDRLAFAAFRPTQRTAIEQIQVPVCEFAETVTDEQLREAFRALNRGHMLTSAERMHSWLHLSVVRDVLNPLEHEWKGKFQKLRSRWRAKNHGLVTLFARLLALVDRQPQGTLYLGSSVAVEMWVANTQHRQFTRMDYKHLNDLISAVVSVYEDVGCDHGANVFLDTVWAVYAIDLKPWDDDDDGGMLVELVNYVTRERAAKPDGFWTNHARAAGDALCRRQDIAKFFWDRYERRVKRGQHLLLMDDDDAQVSTAFTPAVAAAAVVEEDEDDNGLSLWRAKRPRTGDSESEEGDDDDDDDDAEEL